MRRALLSRISRQWNWIAGSTLFLLILTLPSLASAATYYWVGNDAASTNVASNWRTTDPSSCGGGNAVAVPTTVDTIIFDRDCDNGATIDSALTVTVITIQNGYSGTITLHTALTTTTYTQSGGTLRLNGHTFTTAGALTINTASTFTAGTGTLALTGGAATINVDSTLSLYNLTINATTATTKTIANSDTLTVTNTLTLTDGLLSQTTIPAAGTIRAQGSITQASTFDGGTARIVIDGTTDQTFQGTATRTVGLLPLLKIDKASGTLTLSGTIRTANNWSFSGGTLAFSNSTVVFGDASLTIAGSHSLQHVIFDQNSITARTYTIKAGDTLTVLGNLTLDNSTNTSSAGTITINGGFLRVRGDISLPDNAMSHTGTAWMIIDGTGSQLLSGNATSSTGGLINLNINKSSGTLTLSGTIRTAKTWSYSGGTLNPGSSTVVFRSNQTIAGSHTLNNVTLSGSNVTFSLNDATVLTVNGSLALVDGLINGGTIKAFGAVSYASKFDGGTGILAFEGATARTISLRTGDKLPGVALNGVNTTLDASTATGLVAIFNSFSQSAGTYIGGSGSLSIAGDFSLSGGTFHAPGGRLGIEGTFNATAGTFVAHQGTVILNAQGNVSLAASNVRFHHLILNPGLSGYWKFDEGSGVATADASALGNEGVLQLGPQFSTTVPPVSFADSYSMSFDGLNDYVSVGTMGDFGTTLGSGPLSISLWTKTTDNDSALLGAMNVGTNTAFYLYSGFPSASEIEWFTRAEATNNMVLDVDGASTLTNGQWHHIVVVKDGNNTNVMYVYVDGVRMPVTQVVDDAIAHRTVNLNFPIFIGALNSRGTPDSHINGFIDDVRFYRRALHSAEVAQLATGVEHADSGIRYSLTTPLTVEGTLTLNGVTLDDAVSTAVYGSLVRNGGTLVSRVVYTSGTANESGGGGGGGGRTNPSNTSLRSSAKSSTISSLSSFLSLLIAGKKIIYKDIPLTAWFAPYIETLITSGIAQGYKTPEGALTGEFGVAHPVTRAELLKMALEVTHTPLVHTPPHTPSAINTWASDYIATAESLQFSIINPHVMVHESATRAEVIQTIMEALKEPLPSTTIAPFHDVPSSHIYAPAITRAHALGIIQGDTTPSGTLLNRFRPNDPINRAEVAKIIALVHEMGR